MLPKSVNLPRLKKGGDDLDDGLASADNVALDLDDLACVGVDDRGDAGLGGADVANAERGRALDHAETVREMDKLEEVSIDSRREDRLDDGLVQLLDTGL